MIFVGQKHIMRQLKFILPDLYNSTQGENFLLRGRSGFGKTTLAISMAHYLAGNNFQVYLGDWTQFNFRKRVIFIDEVHTMKSFEFLFPIMDSKQHIFIFATNQDGNLPEAFTNRCIHFVFGDYDDIELLIIARESATFSAPDESFMKIIEAGNRNPRIVKSYVDRLGRYFNQNPQVDSNTVDFDYIFQNIFSVENGLDTLSRRYLEVLNDVGGTASISLLKSILHIDESTLKNEVEPILLTKKLIKITSKGRTLIYD